MKLFISPHNDDAVLFGAYTLIREKPLVLTVTDSWIQRNRGANITAEQRRLEDEKAVKYLGCAIVFGAIRDDVIDEWAVRNLFEKFKGFDEVYLPAIQGGNKHHDLIGEIGIQIFPQAKLYSTYKSGTFYSEGNIEVIPTYKELSLKDNALDFYQSQLNYEYTRPHFEAVKGRSEWYI